MLGSAPSRALSGGVHAQAAGDTSRPWPFETILISILLEHGKALADLKSKIKAQEEQVGYEGKGNI
jgi:hypothetical protein